jgi:arsenate reductase
MPNAVLYHNPRCTKSRQALAYLETTDINLSVIEYLKTPLTRPQVDGIFSALGCEHAIEIIRPKEAEFTLAKLNNKSSNDDILEAIVNFPKLLERPILVINNKAAIGRPLANIEALVNE